MQSYITVENGASAEITEKRSRFIAYIRSVSSEEDAVAFVNEIKTKNHDARHNVFAYRLLNGVKRYSDDGEPSGTAGIPILEMVEKEDIYDICIVVTRYFGGILLGTGGLLRAYSLSAKQALSKCIRVQMILCDDLILSCSYNCYGRIPSLISSLEGGTDDTLFGEDVEIIFHLPKYNTERFSKEITEMFNGTLKIEKKGEGFYKKK